MGYYIQLDGVSFHIPASKFGDALAAVKALMLDETFMLGGSWQGDNQTMRWYSWVNTQAVLDSETLADALDAWRWPASINNDGDIDFISFVGEKSGQDNILFSALGPYVTAGSYVAMRGEDGALWRWYFDGQTCIDQEGKVVYL